MIKKVEDFKDRLNKALSIRDIKPIELSEKTGISESTISQYRSGYAKPKEERLAIIANALDVNPAWLMGLDVAMNIETDNFVALDSIDPAVIEQELETRNFTEFIQAYSKASPDVQKAIRLILKVDEHDP